MFSKTLVKYIHSLNNKKSRDQHGVFVAEGPKLVEELLNQNNFTLKELYCLEEWSKTMNKFPSSSEKINIVKDYELEKISLLKTPHSVVGVFFQKKNEIPAKLNSLTLLLDDIQDPGNMGTIIRSCDWFGVSNIICSENCVDIYNPKVVQSTMGSLGNVNISYASLASVIKNHKEIPAYCADLKGLNVKKFQRPEKMILVIGNEGNGVSDEVKSVCSGSLTIKKYGNAESLNAAIATSVFLFSLT